MNQKLVSAVSELNNDLAEILKVVSTLSDEDYQRFLYCFSFEKTRRENISNLYKRYDEMLRASLNTGDYNGFDKLKLERNSLMNEEELLNVKAVFAGSNFKSIGDRIVNLNDIHFNLLNLALSSRTLENNDTITR